MQEHGLQAESGAAAAGPALPAGARRPGLQPRPAPSLSCCGQRDSLGSQDLAHWKGRPWILRSPWGGQVATEQLCLLGTCSPGGGRSAPQTAPNLLSNCPEGLERQLRITLPPSLSLIFTQMVSAVPAEQRVRSPSRMQGPQPLASVDSRVFWEVGLLTLLPARGPPSLCPLQRAGSGGWEVAGRVAQASLALSSALRLLPAQAPGAGSPTLGGRGPRPCSSPDLSGCQGQKPKRCRMKEEGPVRHGPGGLGAGGSHVANSKASQDPAPHAGLLLRLQRQRHALHTRHTPHTPHATRTPHTPHATCHTPYAPHMPHTLHATCHTPHIPHTPHAPHAPHTPHATHSTHATHATHATCHTPSGTCRCCQFPRLGSCKLGESRDTHLFLPTLFLPSFL